MVNTIDQKARRHALAEAVWRIIRRDGFDAASVRAVAAEAGLSAGSVRHFFGTQDALHAFAMEALAHDVEQRVEAVLSAEEPSAATIRDLAIRVLAELLPLTDERREFFLAHLQFVTKATVHPPLQPTARQLFDSMHALTIDLVRSLVGFGAARADLDVERAATDLDVLLDGITLRRLTAPYLLSDEAALALVERFLDDLGGAS